MGVVPRAASNPAGALVVVVVVVVDRLMDQLLPRRPVCVCVCVCVGREKGTDTPPPTRSIVAADLKKPELFCRPNRRRSFAYLFPMFASPRIYLVRYCIFSSFLVASVVLNRSVSL